MLEPGPRRAVDRLTTRLNHLERLVDQAGSGFTVDTANEAYGELYDAGKKPASVLVRAGFVARKAPAQVEGDRDRTARPKPPAANLVRSRGVALRLELALLFARQCSTRAGARTPPVVAPGDEIGLVNLFATGTRRSPGSLYKPRREQMRADQIRKALDLLAGEDLVELGQDNEERSRFDTMWLNRESGPAPGKPPARYKIPDSTVPVISVPIEFFTQGWIQVLTDSEIWNWLVFRHAAKMSSSTSPAGQGVRVDADARLALYDLTRDAWDTHLMLGRYELMSANHGEITSESTPSGQRFRKEPHDFDLDDAILQKPGHAAVTAAVAAVRDEMLEAP